MFPQLTVASGNGFPVQLGNGRGCGGGDDKGEFASSLLSKVSREGQDVFLFVKIARKSRSGASSFLNNISIVAIG